MDNNLELIKPLSPSQVFKVWHDIEKPLEHWKNVWQSKGFKSWEDWR